MEYEMTFTGSFVTAVLLKLSGLIFPKSIAPLFDMDGVQALGAMVPVMVKSALVAAIAFAVADARDMHKAIWVKRLNVSAREYLFIIIPANEMSHKIMHLSLKKSIKSFENPPAL
jgi:hypothetical protein